MIITISSDYTIWHRRLGHANHRVIPQLHKHVSGVPDNLILHLITTRDGCEKGKFNRLPFTHSGSRAKRPLDLLDSNLDKSPTRSINGYKYTMTYLDNHSSFGIIIFLKTKDKEFIAFKHGLRVNSIQPWNADKQMEEKSSYQKFRKPICKNRALNSRHQCQDLNNKITMQNSSNRPLLMKQKSWDIKPTYLMAFGQDKAQWFPSQSFGLFSLCSYTWR